MKSLRGQPGFLLFVMALSIAGVVTSAFLSDWRTAFGSLAALIVGLWGAYVLGEHKFDKSDPRVGATQALRQIVTHFRQLASLETMVQSEREFLMAEARDGVVAVSLVDQTLYHVAFQLNQQLSSANDAVENWKEIVPGEVEALEEQAERREREGGAR